MLVLSRKLGEKIFIGPDICLTVVAIERNKIRVGIEAPREIVVYREELMTEEQRRAREAALRRNRID